MAVDPEHPEEIIGDGRRRTEGVRFALGRIAIFQYLTMGVFLFLVSGFWVLQIRDGDTNSKLAERNRMKTVPMLAPRGRMLDRDGRTLVENHATYTLMISRETLKPEHIDGIAAGLRMEPTELRDRLERIRLLPRYQPLIVKQQMDAADLAFAESHSDASAYPELQIVENYRRLYPRDGLGAHVLGYVAQISEQELNSASFAHFSQGDLIGKTGLERQYNDGLTGIDGERRVLVDSSGRERNVLASKPAVPGKDLQLTLDLDLQVVAELALEGRRGAVVALDPRNGEVLAMVSRPAYDLNAFAAGVSSEYWKQLNSSGDNPLMNRAIQAQFAPGSTFKPIMALAGLEAGVLDASQTIRCPGGGYFHGRYFNCDLKTGHGNVDLHSALVHSCDVFFYNLGDRLGIDRIAQFAESVGIGKKTGIDLPNEAEGLMPSSKWKLRTQHEQWYAGETISVAIGQGAITMTPVQLAVAMGGLARGGVWNKPHLVKADDAIETHRMTFSADNLAAVTAGMWGVVNEGGTGALARIEGVELSGKTGSAQRVSNDLRKSGKLGKTEMLDNGWFVGFAPRENPEIVVAALLEGGEHGRLAAPIARDIVKSYFDKKQRLTQTVPAIPPVALLHPPAAVFK